MYGILLLQGGNGMKNNQPKRKYNENYLKDISLTLSEYKNGVYSMRQTIRRITRTIKEWEAIE